MPFKKIFTVLVFYVPSYVTLITKIYNFPQNNVALHFCTCVYFAHMPFCVPLLLPQSTPQIHFYFQTFYLDLYVGFFYLEFIYKIWYFSLAHSSSYDAIQTTHFLQIM